MSNLSNINCDCPIGIFDSGTGGITVLKEIAHLLPNEKIIYVGDELHFPYGEKSVEDLQRYCIKISDWLINQGVKVIVIACNTATAAALDTVKQHVDIPVIGVVHAGVQAALESTRNNKIAILATKACISLGVYEKNLVAQNPQLQITSVAAPKFVDFVENQLDMIMHSPNQELLDAVDEYTKQIIDDKCDTVVMGCTHFPPLIPVLQKKMGDDINFVSPSQKTAEELKAILQDKQLLSSKSADYKFYTTGDDVSRMKKFWAKKGSFEHLCV